MALRLGRELGRGALGRVVEIESADGGRRLAGKILHPSHRLDDRARAGFAAEATLLGGLRHRNLVEVLGLERIDGEEVLVMERVDGDDLAALIAREHPLPVARQLAIARGIADGLAAAHRAGLIHRDLKPSNVLIAARDVPKIADFGMARTASFAGAGAGGALAADAASGVSAPAVVGTPDYLAPEAVDPLAVDARADLYALGCVMHEMATGRPPYAAPTAFALLEAHRSAPLPELAGVDGGVRALIRWLLARSPADRPQSAAIVVRAIDELAAADGGAAAGAAHGSTALARAAGGALAGVAADGGGGGACAICGAALLAEVPVCFACATAQPRLERGRHSVVVVGPGEHAHKLDASLRRALTGWLRDNPTLGLDPTRLGKQLPRLPFALVTRIAESSADQLVASLAALGLEAVAIRGGRFAYRPLRRKAWTLTARFGAIIGSSSIGLIHTFASNPLFLVAAPVVALGAGWLSAGRAAGRRRARPPRSPRRPPALAAAYERVAGVLPAIDERRHREGLRAVVQRAAAASARADVARDPRLIAELARLVDLATVAAARVDELERALAGVDLRSADPEVRARLRDRDRWAARLLDAAAFLDAFRASRVAAAGDRDADQRLADLTAHVEALEELAAT